MAGYHLKPHCVLTIGLGLEQVVVRTAQAHFGFVSLVIWLNSYLLCQALAAANGISDLSCGRQDLQLRHVGSSSLTRDRIWTTTTPYTGSVES